MRNRRIILVVTFVSMATLLPYNALADLLQSTTLACNDGANVNLTLDTTALNALTSAVSAVSLYPAGDPALTCALSTPTTTQSNGNNPKYAYIVGGGRQTIEDPTQGLLCAPYSFSLEARVVEGAAANTASGHFNRTQSPNTLFTSCSIFPNEVSQLRVDIDCLMIAGSTANMSGLVSKATGFFATSAGGSLTPNARVVITATDNVPYDGIAYRSPGGTPTPVWCDSHTSYPTSAGSIAIHD